MSRAEETGEILRQMTQHILPSFFCCCLFVLKVCVDGWKGEFWVLLVKQYQSASAVPAFRTSGAGLLLSKWEVTSAWASLKMLMLSEEHSSSARPQLQLPHRGGPCSPGQVWDWFIDWSIAHLVDSLEMQGWHSHDLRCSFWALPGWLGVLLGHAWGFTVRHKQEMMLTVYAWTDIIW